jgi:hypothetical protein
VVSVNFHPLSGDANAYNNVDFNPNILLYTFNGGANEVFSRNSGPFWEPGMFTIFINIALLFSLILKNSILNKYSMVLLITNITTLSTTGYLAMFTTLFFIYLISTQKGTKKVLNYIFFLIILIVFILVWNLDFFGAKIINDLDVASEKGYSRFGAALIHFAQIQQSPWMGHGLNIREIDWKLTNSVTPNGLTNIIRTYGIPVSLFYYVLLYMSSKRIIGMITPNNKATFTFLLFFVLLILAFSQDITTRHLYLSFLFLSICIPKNLKIYQQ